MSPILKSSCLESLQRMLGQETKVFFNVAIEHKINTIHSRSALLQAAKLSLQDGKKQTPKNISHNLSDVGADSSLPQQELYLGRM